MTSLHKTFIEISSIMLYRLSKAVAANKDPKKAPCVDFPSFLVFIDEVFFYFENYF